MRTRFFVMALVGWCALSAAPVVALSPPLPAAFFVVAAGLAAMVTLRFSERIGGVVAVLAAALFVLALVLGPVPPWALGPDDLARLGPGLTRAQTVLPGLLGGLGLLGAVVLGDLASSGLEWDAVLRRVARATLAPVEPPPPAPAAAADHPPADPAVVTRPREPEDGTRLDKEEV